MAQRKKTPDVLADQQRPTRRTVGGSASEAEQTGVRSLTAEATPSEEPSFDPLAILFPRSEEAQTSSATRIKLEVRAAEELAREIESSTVHAFHALSDVQLATEATDWLLVILSVAVQAPSRAPHGVALTAVAAEIREPSGEGGLRTPPHLATASSVEQVSVFRGTWLRVGNRSQLQELCEQIVADFDRRYLASWRLTAR